MEFSKRTNWDFHTNQLTSLLEQMRADGQVILDLTESNPTRCGFIFFLDEVLGGLSHSSNVMYQPNARGLLSAREHICGYYQAQGIVIEPEQIFLTSSTSEGYSFLFRLLANAGDSILFPRPSYPLFHFLCDLNDVNLAFYPLAYRGEQWAIHFMEAEKSLSADSKAFVVVNPNNPTGSYIKQNEQQPLNDLCQQHQMALISDEVFQDYRLDGDAPSASLAGNTENLTFVLGGLSKSLCLPQMKLSWIVASGPPKILQDALTRLEVIADTYLSVSAPSQNALKQWMPLKSSIQAECLQRIRGNYAFLRAFFSGQKAVKCLHAEGGWYAVLSLSGQVNEEALVLDLLKRYKVFIHPGYFFDFEDETCLVASLLTPEDILRQGAEGLARCVAEL